MVKGLLFLMSCTTILGLYSLKLNTGLKVMKSMAKTVLYAICPAVLMKAGSASPVVP